MSDFSPYPEPAYSEAMMEEAKDNPRLQAEILAEAASSVFDSLDQMSLPRQIFDHNDSSFVGALATPYKVETKFDLSFEKMWEEGPHELWNRLFTKAVFAEENMVWNALREHPGVICEVYEGPLTPDFVASVCEPLWGPEFAVMQIGAWEDVMEYQDDWASIYSPIEKHELAIQGRLGNIKFKDKGPLQLYTDGFRYDTTQTLPEKTFLVLTGLAGSLGTSWQTSASADGIQIIIEAGLCLNPKEGQIAGYLPWEK